MYNKLLKLNIYKNRIIDNPTNFDSNKYYYFYKDISHNQIFAIEQNISINEYLLLQTMFIEKKIYDNNFQTQKVFEYLFENKTYPFKNNVSFIIFTVHSLDEITVNDLLENIFNDIKIIKVSNYYLAFCKDFTQDIHHLFLTIGDDLGYNINIHQGIVINKNYKGLDILKYLDIYQQSKLVNRTYTDYADLIIECGYQNLPSINSIIYLAIKDLIEEENIKDLILTFLNNNLNVLQTSRILYMNRNTLLNKFDYIYKKTGFDLKKFAHASAMYLLLKNN